MYVREVMTTPVYTIAADASFKDIIEFLLEYNVSGAPIIDSDGHLLGVVSEKDLFRFIFPEQEEFYTNPDYWMNQKHLEKEATLSVRDKTAKDLITRKVITVGPNDPVMKACALLLIHGIRRLPVLDDDNLVGIVTTNDLYRNFFKKMYVQ